MTLRLATVAHAVPDQDIIRESQAPQLDADVEASQRPIVWDGEELGVDEECEVSFETLDEKALSALNRHPLGKLDDDGVLKQMAPPSQRYPTGRESGFYDDDRTVDLLEEEEEETLRRKHHAMTSSLQSTTASESARPTGPFKPVRLPTAQYISDRPLVDDEATQKLSDKEKLIEAYVSEHDSLLLIGSLLRLTMVDC